LDDGRARGRLIPANAHLLRLAGYAVQRVIERERRGSHGEDSLLP
jgi:hypothetical protein